MNLNKHVILVCSECLIFVVWFQLQYTVTISYNSNTSLFKLKTPQGSLTTPRTPKRPQMVPLWERSDCLVQSDNMTWLKWWFKNRSTNIKIVSDQICGDLITFFWSDLIFLLWLRFTFRMSIVNCDWSINQHCRFSIENEAVFTWGSCWAVRLVLLLYVVYFYSVRKQNSNDFVPLWPKTGERAKFSQCEKLLKLRVWALPWRSCKVHQ